MNQAYYVADPRDWDCDDTYSILVGPDGLLCMLGEPEDRSFELDAATIVIELNRLHKRVQELEEEVERLEDIAHWDSFWDSFGDDL